MTEKKIEELTKLAQKAIVARERVAALERELAMLRGRVERFIACYEDSDVATIAKEMIVEDSWQPTYESAFTARDELLGHIEQLNQRHEEDLAWKQRAEAAEAELSALQETCADVAKALAEPMAHTCERYGACGDCGNNWEREARADQLLNALNESKNSGTNNDR